MVSETNRGKKQKVLNFGSLNIDYVYDVAHINREGETQQSKARHVYCGGKGLNQSLALKKAGVSVYQAGAVGADDSEILISLLADHKIDTTFISHKAMASGHAIIQRDLDGKNSILLYGGANMQIDHTEIDTTLANFAQGDLLILQNEISEMAYLMAQASKRGMVIVFNPSPFDKSVLDYPLDAVNYLILNEHEAEAICDFEGSSEAHAKALIDRYPKTKIVLTMGENGVLYQDGNTRLFVPALKVKAVDTTAAGDTFTGYFIASLLRNLEVQTALEIATRASAIAVTRPGAAPSIPEASEVFSNE
ncbi:ribokinase [Fusibacter paucivorans]|uniref:Ribokinase n=1 Tax=Fusibacter paucivorans TaxID=76009 RepID=A0ABS5PQS9_9FIRM|nr:ribokinase [Fusibacter paucivorans]